MRCTTYQPDGVSTKHRYCRGRAKMRGLPPVERTNQILQPPAFYGLEGTSSIWTFHPNHMLSILYLTIQVSGGRCGPFTSLTVADRLLQTSMRASVCPFNSAERLPQVCLVPGQLGEVEENCIKWVTYGCMVLF